MRPVGHQGASDLPRMGRRDWDALDRCRAMTSSRGVPWRGIPLGVKSMHSKLYRQPLHSSVPRWNTRTCPGPWTLPTGRAGGPAKAAVLPGGFGGTATGAGWKAKKAKGGILQKGVCFPRLEATPAPQCKSPSKAGRRRAGRREDKAGDSAISRQPISGLGFPPTPGGSG